MSAARANATLLLTSAGRRVELLRAFRASANDLGIDLRIVACDVAPELSAACRIADDWLAVPKATDPAYVAVLLDAVATHGIDLVVPTIDPELLPLAKARGAFSALGADVAISGPELVAIAGDKLATAAFLAQHHIPSPATTTLECALAGQGNWSGPVFAKPRFGSASRGAQAVGSIAEVTNSRSEPMLVQKLLKGREYTVNLFFDDTGRLVTAVPHRRVSVRAGEVEKGTTERVPQLLELARQLAEVLREPRGAMCFQAFVEPDGSASVFEINARFGGGYPLAHAAGATSARWLLEERLGLPRTAGGDWRAGLTMLRYDAAVFVEP